MSRHGIEEPLSRALTRVLRRAVVEHAESERRVLHPPVLHVGVPGVTERSIAVEPEEQLDHALRTDMVHAMARAALQAKRVPLLWLTRPEGCYEAEDLLWSTAVHAAGAELGVALDLVVVTRRSWHDPRSGVHRVWSRPVRPPHR